MTKYFLIILAVVVLIGYIGTYFLLGNRVTRSDIIFKNSVTDWNYYLTYQKNNPPFETAGADRVNVGPRKYYLTHLVIANESTTSSKRFGFELKSLGYSYPTRNIPESEPAATTTDQMLSAYINTKDAVNDPVTGPATASCVSFELSPHTIAYVPVLYRNNGTTGLRSLPYEILVKEGDDVSCKQEDGLLKPNQGEIFAQSTLEVISGHLEDYGFRTFPSL